MDQHKPVGYSSVSPYLIVDGAEATIEFLKQVFDATDIRRFPTESGLVMHAEVRIDDSVIMLADAPPPDRSAVPAHVHTYVRDVDETYRKALRSGAVSVQAPKKKDDADRRAGVTDKGGTTWWIATKVE